MRKLLIALVVVAGVASGVSSAFANVIRVTISDGSTTLTSSTSGLAARGFVLQASSAAGTTTTLNLLALTASTGGNCTAPCTRHFPSGRTTALSTDTFRLQDIGSTNRIRVVKTDASTDKIELRGIRVTSLAAGAGKTLRIIFETLPGAFTAIPNGTYSAGAALKGSFRQGVTIAPPCLQGESTPCVRQLMQVQGVSLNGQVSGAPLGTWTVSVPCSPNSGTAPCGPGGSWNPNLLSPADQFFATDTGSINITNTNCPRASGNCQVVHKGTLEVRATAANQVFTATNSVNQYFAGVPVGDPNGLAGVLAAIAAEGGTDVWLAYDSCLAAYRAVPRPPLTNETRNIQNNANLPVKFGVEKANFEVPDVEAFPIASILTGEEVLPPFDQACNDSGYVVFVPGGPLAFRDLSTVTFAFDVITGPFPSADARLGTLQFEDCSAAAEIRVQIALERDGVAVGNLVVYLGRQGANFQSGCDNPSLSGVNLVQNLDARIDPSFLIPSHAEGCCLTWTEARRNGAFGRYTVRAITFVIDKGTVTPPATPANHQVIFATGNVNGSTSAGSLKLVTGFEPTCAIPPDGRSIQFFKVVNGVPEEQPVHTETNTTIKGCEVQASVNVNSLLPQSGSQYDVHLQFFGGISVREIGRLRLQ